MNSGFQFETAIFSPLPQAALGWFGWMPLRNGIRKALKTAPILLVVFGCSQPSAFKEKFSGESAEMKGASPSGADQDAANSSVGGGPNEATAVKPDHAQTDGGAPKAEPSEEARAKAEDEFGATDDLPRLSSATLGLAGGHFDLDTSSRVYAPNAGVTDGHVHAFDDAYNTTGANFFALPTKNLNSISEAIGDPAKRFVLIVANSALSPGAVLEVNGKLFKISDIEASVRATLKGGAPLPVYTFGAPTRDGDRRLEGLKVAFAATTLAKNGLVATATGCVRKNVPGPKGEYRNGALTIQALPADAIDIDPQSGVAKSSILWEATLFWHKTSTCLH